MKKILLSACVLIGCVFGSLWGSDATGKVNINTATLAELDTLPGIGPVIAGRIIEFRTRNGPFRRGEDLMNVRGIGEKKFMKLRERILISLPDPSTGQGASPVSAGKSAGKPAQKPPPKSR